MTLFTISKGGESERLAKKVLERYNFAIAPALCTGVSFIICTDVCWRFRARWWSPGRNCIEKLPEEVRLKGETAFFLTLCSFVIYIEESESDSLNCPVGLQKFDWSNRNHSIGWLGIAEPFKWLQQWKVPGKQMLLLLLLVWWGQNATVMLLSNVRLPVCKYFLTRKPQINNLKD